MWFSVRFQTGRTRQVLLVGKKYNKQRSQNKYPNTKFCVLVITILSSTAQFNKLELHKIESFTFYIFYYVFWN